MQQSCSDACILENLCFYLKKDFVNSEVKESVFR